jgi:sulfite exporter TauE/SafE/copper chaperone CopZ
MKNIKKYTLHVHGMHCTSCVILTESELKDHAKVEHAVANLETCCVDVQGDFGDITREEVALLLSPLIEKHGYKLSTEKEVKKVDWSEFKIAVPLALGFMLIFFGMQKLGIVNFISSSEVSYATAFLVGLVASVSTCMAVVGSLVLSISANYAKEGNKILPQMLFHIGRIISFFVLGGVIGAIGSTFQLGTTGTFLMTLAVATAMFILGLNLLDIFPWVKRLQPTLPKFLSNSILGVKKVNHILTPILLGVATFFLPCGFTQSMQVYALSTGSFWSGAMTMLVFALGTLPILAILSFSSLSIQGKANSGIYFKTAGIIVILFALFNLINSLVIIGLIQPVFNF